MKKIAHSNDLTFKEDKNSVGKIKCKGNLIKKTNF